MAICQDGAKETLKKEITCTLCLEISTDPRILHGSHFFCNQCIVKLLEAVGIGKPIECPICREEISLPEGGVDKLSLANWVFRLKDNFAELAKQKICPEHGEPLKLFCFECRLLVCYECILKGGHKEHKWKKNVDAAPEKRQELRSDITPLKNIYDNFTEAVNKIEVVLDAIKTKGDLVEKYVETRFKELHAILDERKEELLIETKLGVFKKVDNLQVQQKNVFEFGTLVHKLIEKTEDSVSHCSDDEIMSECTALKETIEENIKRYGSSSNIELEPLENAHADVILQASKFSDFCEKKCYPIEVDLFNDEAKIDMSEYEADMRKTKVLLYSNNSEAKMNCFIKSSRGEVICECDVTRVGYIVHLIQCDAPQHSGIYEIHVLVDGQHAVNSPAILTVKDTRTIPEKMWSGLRFRKS